MKARLINEIGTRSWLRVYWGKDCPGRSYHNAEIFLMDTNKLEDWDIGGKPSDYSMDRWPKKCDHCERMVPLDAPRDGFGEAYDAPNDLFVHYQVFHKRLYSSPSGNPEPVDLYYSTWEHSLREDGTRWGWCEWANCDGKHLIAILPNGGHWNIDGRASNCTMKDDKTHRCWVRHGSPPDVHVDKAGHTCQAGAGSIAVEGYHGFLHNGNFT